MTKTGNEKKNKGGAPLGSKNALGAHGGPEFLHTRECIEKIKDYIENYKEYGNQIPTLGGLSLVLGITRRTLQMWKERAADPNYLNRGDDDPLSEYEIEKKETLQIVGDLLDKLHSAQEVQTLDNGLTGAFNATIAKLVLHHHGYHDKVDNTLADPNGGPVKTSLIFEPVGPDYEQDS